MSPSPCAQGRFEETGWSKTTRPALLARTIERARTTASHAALDSVEHTLHVHMAQRAQGLFVELAAFDFVHQHLSGAAQQRGSFRVERSVPVRKPLRQRLSLYCQLHRGAAAVRSGASLPAGREETTARSLSDLPGCASSSSARNSLYTAGI